MGDRHPRRPRPLRHRRHRQPAAGGPANNIDELQALCDQFRWHTTTNDRTRASESRFRPRPTRRCPKSAPAIHAPTPQDRPTGAPGVAYGKRPLPQTQDRHRHPMEGPTGHRHRQQARSRRRARPHHRSRPARTNPRPVGTYHRNGRKRDRPRKNPETAPPQVFLRTVSRAPRSRRSTAN